MKEMVLELRLPFSENQKEPLRLQSRTWFSKGNRELLKDTERRKNEGIHIVGVEGVFVGLLLSHSSILSPSK